MVIFRQQKNFGPNIRYCVVRYAENQHVDLFFYMSVNCSTLHRKLRIHEKQQMRIQEGHFLKIALNLDLTLSDDGECRTFFDSPRNH